MNLNEVISFFEEKGFSKTKFLQKNEVNLLEFDNIYANNNRTEIYILEEKEKVPFTKDEIEMIELKVAAFIPFLRNNNPLRTNINLLLLCPLKQYKNEGSLHSVDEILGFEKSKYYCRKIFLDTSSSNFSEELSLIPAFPLFVEVNISPPSKQLRLIEEVKRSISNELFDELAKEYNDVNLNLITSIVRRRIDG